MASKSNIPSDAGHPVFVQHWVEPEWISLQRTAQSSTDPVHGEDLSPLLI